MKIGNFWGSIFVLLLTSSASWASIHIDALLNGGCSYYQAFVDNGDKPYCYNLCTNSQVMQGSLDRKFDPKDRLKLEELRKAHCKPICARGKADKQCVSVCESDGKESTKGVKCQKLYCDKDTDLSLNPHKDEPNMRAQCLNNNTEGRYIDPSDNTAIPVHMYEKTAAPKSSPGNKSSGKESKEGRDK